MKIVLPSVVVVALLFSASAVAQHTTGSIAGRIVDQQKAAVRGARVTARNPRTGFERTEISDDEGMYRLSVLPVGTYDVSVATPGFARTLRQDVEVNVAGTRVIDLTLNVGSVQQTVTVTAPAVDSTSSTVGAVVDPRRVQSLPLDGRQFANLTVTVPGVGLGFHSDPTKGNNYAPFINGGAGRNINYLVDGGDNNDDTVGGLLQQFPLEAIQEFNFQTQRFKAEYGRSDGGVMNVVTKSGANTFQGSLFELFRDKSLNALTTTERLAAAQTDTSPTKGDYRRNQFGGSLGGPLVVNKLHFFFAMERTVQDTSQTVNTQGLFPSQDGVFPMLYRENIGTAKLSANVNATQYVTVRYGGDTNSFPFGASPVSTPNNWADASNTFNSLNVNHNWVLGGTKLNELVLQFSNYHDRILPRSTLPNITYPTVNGVTTGGSLAAPQATEQTKYQFKDDLSWHVSGHGGLGHDFKIGLSFIDEPRLFIASATGTGVVAYTMAAGTAGAGVSTVTKYEGEAAANIPTKQYGVYFQDDWRLGDRLTLNAGIRYDLVTGLDFDQSKNPNFVLIQAAAKAGSLTSIPGLQDFGLDSQSDRNNFQPRLGAVYDMNGGKDILRGGWGVYTDFGYTNSNVLNAALDASGTRFGPAFVASGSPLRNSDGSIYQVGQSLTNLAGSNQVVMNSPLLIGAWADPRLQEPYQLQTNVGWSHELTSTTTISADFVNSLGRDLNYKPRVNQLVAGSTSLRRVSALLPSLSPNNSSNRPSLSVGKSQYNGLILSTRRRLSNGVDVLGSYTLSRSLSTIGNASDELNTANIQDPANPFDNPAQLGPNAATDARHRISISAVVQLPHGVQVAPLFLYRSALPVALIDGRDINGDGDRVDLPATAYAVTGTNATTGVSTFQATGPCTTVNCGRGWPESQLNLRVSKAFRVGFWNIEAICEVFNLFNAINPSNVVNGQQVNRTVSTSTGALSPLLLQPASFSGDSQRPEQRAGQLGVRISF